MFNARSLNNKLVHLHSLLDSNTFDLIFVTETWLDPISPDSLLLNASNYKIFRQDRSSRGGGCAAFVKNNIPVSRIITISLNSSEILCLSLKNKIYVLCVYHPPSAVQDRIQTKELCDAIDLLAARFPSNLVVVGDFNLPNIDWTNGRNNGNMCHDMFYDLCLKCGFHQYVPNCTRENTILDLVLTNNTNNNFLSNVHTSCKFTNTCDHDSVIFTINWVNSRSIQPIGSNDTPIRNFYKADYASIVAYLLKVDWQTISASSDVYQFWDSICYHFNMCIDRFVPTILARSKSLPKSIRKLASIKHKYYKKSKTDPTFKSKFKEMSKLYDATVYAQNLSVEQKIIDDFANNPKSFYSFINRKINSTDSVPTLVNDSGLSAHEDKEKADLLNDFFGSVFTHDNGITPVYTNVKPNANYSINNIIFSHELVYNTLSKLPSKHSITPDGFSAIFLKNCAVAITLPYTILFEKSMMSGCIPDVWKKAIICPVFKKGNRSSPKNYRPISITCISCKIMESVIAKSLTNYLQLYHLLSKNQFGFLPKRSACTQLLSTLNDWTLSINNNLSIDAVYIDFTKAFDSVCHSKLLHKLKTFGIRDFLLNWIQCFLSNRIQTVRINNSYSNHLNVISGVPQGSVLGPILFLLYINDVDDCLVGKCCLKLFADDCKFYCDRDKSVDICNTLKKFDIWKLNCQLGIALDKCIVIRFGKITLPSHVYSIDEFVLPDVTYIRDLGITFDCKLKVSRHCTNIKSKAYSRSYTMFKCFSNRNSNLLIKLYLIYIRPLAEFCTPVWSPHLLKDIYTIEKIQKYFTRRICILCKIPYTCYSDRLKLFKINSLEYRRIYFDLCTTFKIIHNLTDLSPSDFFIITNSCYNTRFRHNFHLSSLCSGFSNDTRRYFFSERVIPIWNNLPLFIVNSPNLLIFKSRINTFDLSRNCIAFPY